MWWEADWLRGEEVAGKNEGADQKLRGWWDARLGSSCVTALHKDLRRQRGSGSEVISMSVLPAHSERARDAGYSNSVQFIHPSTLNQGCLLLTFLLSLCIFNSSSFKPLLPSHAGFLLYS